MARKELFNYSAHDEGYLDKMNRDDIILRVNAKAGRSRSVAKEYQKRLDEERGKVESANINLTMAYREKEYWRGVAAGRLEALRLASGLRDDEEEE